MLQVALGFIQSIEVLARAMVNKPSQPQYQYPPCLPVDMLAQVRMHGPVPPTGYTQINTSYQEQAYRYVKKNSCVTEVHNLLLVLDLYFCVTKKSNLDWLDKNSIIYITSSSQILNDLLNFKC